MVEGGGGGGAYSYIYGEALSKRGTFLGFMYQKSPANPPPSNKPSLFRESKLISPPPLPLIIIHWWIDFINQLQCMTVKLCMDWSRMFLSLGCKTSNHCPWALLLCILASFLWIKSDTIVFAKFINKSSLSSKPPSKVFEINKARGGGGGGGWSWFMVYEMVGISLSEVYERVENFVILVHEKA